MAKLECTLKLKDFDLASSRMEGLTLLLKYSVQNAIIKVLDNAELPDDFEIDVDISASWDQIVRQTLH